MFWDIMILAAVISEERSNLSWEEVLDFAAFTEWLMEEAC